MSEITDPTHLSELLAALAAILERRRRHDELVVVGGAGLLALGVINRVRPPVIRSITSVSPVSCVSPSERMVA